MDKKELLKKYEITEMYLDWFLNRPQKVQQLMMLIIMNQHLALSIESLNIDSPIEEIFITAFDLFIKFQNKENIMLFSQYPIEIDNKKYIVDFYFEKDPYVNEIDTDRKIVIECDGYDFHQKTKEQVQRDNEREYNLKMAGYEVIRFSGSQIFKEPFKCAEDTYNFIMKDVKEKENGKKENDRS